MDRLSTFAENSATGQENTQQIVNLFNVLLDGSALVWWNSIITAQDRIALRERRLPAMDRTLPHYN